MKNKIKKEKIISSNGVMFVEQGVGLEIKGFENTLVKDWYIIGKQGNWWHRFKFYLVRLLFREAFKVQKEKIRNEIANQINQKIQEAINLLKDEK